MAPSTTSEKYDEPPPYTTRDPREPVSASTTTSDSRYRSQNPQTYASGYEKKSEPAAAGGLGILGGKREGRRGRTEGGGGGRLQRHREKKAARREGLMSLVGGVIGRK